MAVTLTPRERDALRTVGFLLWPYERRVQRRPAQRSNGNWANACDRKACAWCLLGAVDLVSRHFGLIPEVVGAQLVRVCRRRFDFWKTDQLLAEPFEAIIRFWDGYPVRRQNGLLRALQGL